MKLFLVRPPSYYAFHFPPEDSFLPPLGLACLASYLRKTVPEIEVKIIDCPGEKIGWRTLKRIIYKERPQIIAAGGYLHNYHESIKVFEFAKNVNSSIVNIAGGPFFSWMPEFVLRKFTSVDYIVRFEGEETFKTLLLCLLNKGDLDRVEGIAFRKDGVPHLTPCRFPIEDLDSLPFPGYDFLPLHKYDSHYLFWPNVVSIESGRGCIFDCVDCFLNRFWGKPSSSDADFIPYLRLKSPQRVLDEIDLLYKKYHRRFFFFATPLFNASSNWLNIFFNKFLRKKYTHTNFFAYLKAEFVIRDKSTGIIRMMARAGMKYVLVGITKRNFFIIPETFRILRKHGIATVGAMAFTPTYTLKELKEIFMYICKEKIPIRIFIFIPFPGTYLWRRYIQRGILENDDYYQKDYFLDHSWHKVCGKLYKNNKLKLIIGASQIFYSLRFFLREFDQYVSTFVREPLRVCKYSCGYALLSPFIIFHSLIYSKILSKINKYKINMWEFFLKPFWYDK